MAFSTTAADLLKVLNPAAATTRGSFSQSRRPWTPGYRAKLDVAAAALVAGFNQYSPNQKLYVARMEGAGAAAAATSHSYTLQGTAGTDRPALPTSNAAAIVEAPVYANAACIIYPKYAREEAILLERIGTGGADVNRAMWRVDTAGTFSIATAWAAGPLFSDVPKGWMIEIQVPLSADIVTIFDAAVGTVVDVKDFLFAGGAGKTAVATLDRIFF